MGDGVVLALPESLRGELKEPMGPLFTDAERLLASVGAPLVTVGDVVTAHVERAGVVPDVAVVDDRTERRPVDADVKKAVDRLPGRVPVANPPAGLSRDLLVALGEALADREPTVLVVDGEEDLATLPAVLAAPVGASVVYGQPGEGMVHVEVTPEAKATVRDLLARMDGDLALACELLGVEP